MTSVAPPTEFGTVRQVLRFHVDRYWPVMRLRARCFLPKLFKGLVCSFRSDLTTKTSNLTYLGPLKDVLRRILRCHCYGCQGLDGA